MQFKTSRQYQINVGSVLPAAGQISKRNKDNRPVNAIFRRDNYRRSRVGTVPGT
jgi:hypothetical protein